MTTGRINQVAILARAEEGRGRRVSAPTPASQGPGPSFEEGRGAILNIVWVTRGAGREEAGPRGARSPSGTNVRPIRRGTIVRLPRPCSVPKGKPVARPLTGLRVEEGSQPRGFPQHGRSSKPTARAAPARRETPRDVNRGTPTAPAQARRSLQHGFGSKLSHRESVQATQPPARPRPGPWDHAAAAPLVRVERAAPTLSRVRYSPGSSELQGADQAPGCVGAPVSIATHRTTGLLGLFEGPLGLKRRARKG